MRINPLLLLDFYKSTHPEQYPKGITKVVEYYTPRMSRLKGEDKLVMFALQGYIKEYLIEAFNDEFFSKDISEILSEYTRLFDITLGHNIVGYDKIMHLHKLGYLPIEIKAVPEGTRVPIRVPMFEISNTHPDFAWLPGTLETSLSATLAHAQLSANVGYMYRQIVNEAYAVSVDNDVSRARAIGDFSMRGQESIESAIKSSAGFALSFLNTATVPMIPYFEQYYGANIETEDVAYGLTSTEHSVMCSNFAIDSDEGVMFKRLLTELYPSTSFTVVADSYDYWNFVHVIVPKYKKEVLEHNGCVGIRGDSGDPVKIVTQTVFSLWKTFGGTINSKGFKVLDWHIRAVYGDSITPRRLREIYKILIEAGFACNNVMLASGSFSLQCFEEEAQNLDELKALETVFVDGYITLELFTSLKAVLAQPILQPFTRDTFGIALKATYCEVDGKPVQIFKDPKTDTGNFKKSQRGLCVVYIDKDSGEIVYRDGFDSQTIKQFNGENLLETVFIDGKMVKEYTLGEIRARLHEGNF